MAAIMLSACNENRQGQLEQTNRLRQMVEDSIQLGNSEYALATIDSGLTAAKDSDIYYLWLCTKNKANYLGMDAKAMLATNKRISDYLKRNPDSTLTRQWVKAECLMSQSVFHTAIMGRPDSGLVYNAKALEAMRHLKGCDNNLIVTLTNRAFFYKQDGQLDYSADAYLSALNAADSLQASYHSRIAIMLGIASVYNAMQDLENANIWWKQLERELPKMKDMDKYIFYNDQGNYYFFAKDYSNAKRCFENAANITKGDPQKEWDYYTAQANLAEIYICLGDADRATQAIDEMEAFCRKVGFDMLLYYADTERIKIALLRGDKAEAARIHANSRIDDNIIPDQRLMRMKAEKDLFSITGQYDKAFHIQETIQHIDDSIRAANIKMRMSANMLKYRHDKRIMQQQREIEKKEMTSIIAWIICAVAIMGVALLTLTMIMRRRKQKIRDLTMRQKLVEQKMENVRNRISPHFIFNALNHEMLSQIRGEEVDFSQLTQLLRRGLDMAEHLHTSLSDELSFIDYFVSIEGRKLGAKFQYVKDIEDGVDVANTSLPTMTIQLFVENAIKHGLRPIAAIPNATPVLTIQARRKDNGVIVRVIDNGSGLDGISMGENTGMRTIRQTIQILNAHNHDKIAFGIDNNPKPESGCTSWIYLPDNFKYEI